MSAEATTCFQFRKISVGLAVQVPFVAPARLSVADAEATEGEGAALAFTVTLDPAAAVTVTVDYATADGTATAGEDYTETNGTLTFTPGETSKTISVPIADDAVEDSGETLTLTLSNAAGAEIDDAEATGTIRNTDALGKITNPRSRSGRRRHLRPFQDSDLPSDRGGGCRDA